MIRTILAAFALTAAPALAETVTKPSAHSVSDTADRLVAAIEGAGATVMARVPHSEGAARVDLELPEAELVIFGNPAVGTLIMQQDLRAGVILPLRVLVHADGDGGAAVTYQTAETMFAGLNVDISSEPAQRINGALGNLTNAATAAD
ncbi:MAG: DUF302 domain-containing protein [Pseudomonadota bacterium]